MFIGGTSFKTSLDSEHCISFALGSKFSYKNGDNGDSDQYTCFGSSSWPLEHIPSCFVLCGIKIAISQVDSDKQNVQVS